MSLELSIRGKRIDLLPGKPIPVTYSANDLAELKNRQSNFTRRFKIPMTHNNREVLELSEQLNSNTNFPYQQHSARLIQDGIQLIPDGIFELKRSARDFTGQIISGNADLFDKMDGKNIRELDLSEFNHIWNVQNALDSRTNIDGYVYALINYGGINDPQFGFDISNTPASVFLHTVIERIISEAGFTLEGLNLAGDFLNRVSNGNGELDFGIFMYDNMIIPFTNDELPNEFETLTDISTLLPDINQADFFKAFMQMFGLFPQTNNISKKVKLFQLFDVAKNKDKARNWTDKLDMKNNPSIEYKIRGYSQINNLKYTQDEREDDLGIGSININDPTIKGEQDLFQVLFSPTTGGSRPFIKKIDSDQLFTISTKPRILVLSRLSGGLIDLILDPIRLQYGPNPSPQTFGISNVTCHFIFGTVGDDLEIPGLSFGDIGGRPNGLISNNYKEFDSMFDKIKRIKVKLNLDQTDIGELDHSIPIYFAQFQDFFYLNRISNYITGQLSDTELIRL